MTHASLCFLSYERPQFLEMAIVSAVEMAAPEKLEVIVHDDGSTNLDVHRVLEALLAAGYVSTIIKNPPGHNEGVGRAINRSFALATGDPILKLDQDLIFKPGWLQKARAILENDRVGMLGLFRYWVDPVDHRKMEIPWTNPVWSGPGVPYHYVKDFVGSAMVIPRAILDKFGPFEEHSTAFAEDLAYKTKLCGCGYQLALADEDLATNQGFGVGPSTVVVAGEDGRPTVHRINEKPRLVGGNE